MHTYSHFYKGIIMAKGQIKQGKDNKKKLTVKEKKAKKKDKQSK